MSNHQVRAKTLAAQVATEFVKSGMTLGLGSGSTSELFVRALGERSKSESLEIRAVATSERTAKLAEECGIELIDSEEVKSLDLAFDGADEVDPKFRMIKGRGGALLREKIVASVAGQRIIMVDRSKLVTELGENHFLPIEIASFGRRWILDRLLEFGSEVVLRSLPEGSPYRTDGGNFIADLRTGPIRDPKVLEEKLLAIPGVYETGLFVGLCDILIIGDETGTEVRRNEMN